MFSDTFPKVVVSPEQNRRFIDSVLVPAANTSFKQDFAAAGAIETIDVHKTKLDEKHWQEIGFSATKHLIDPEPVTLYTVYRKRTLDEQIIPPTIKEKEKSSGYNMSEETSRAIIYEEIFQSTTENDAIPTRSFSISFLLDDEVVDVITSNMTDIVELLGKVPDDKDIMNYATGLEAEQFDVFDGFDENDVRQIIRILRYLRLLEHENGTSEQA